MISSKSNDQKGFTIIEVVLVLAIAGLIFLVVFLALPALQKSQRDNARKQDIGKIVAGVQQYMVDHDRQMLNDGDQTFNGYFSNLSQVTLISVEADVYSCRWIPSNNYQVAIRVGCTCSQVLSGTGQIDPNSRKAPVYILLENGGVFCQDV